MLLISSRCRYPIVYTSKQGYPKDENTANSYELYCRIIDGVGRKLKIPGGKAEVILQGVSRPVDLTNRDDLIAAVTTCLSSKVVGQNSDVIRCERQHTSS